MSSETSPVPPAPRARPDERPAAAGITARTGPVTHVPGRSTLLERLGREGHAFDFHQALWLLEQLYPERVPVGREGPPHKEVARLVAQLSLGFPASAIHALELPGDASGQARMEVGFFGLTGPSGVLPRYYTEMLLRLAQETSREEHGALRSWLDLFNHRLLSLFHRSWEKYRFQIPYARAEVAKPLPDTFTRGLLSLIGVGLPSLRERLRVSVWDPGSASREEQVLGRVPDLALLRYAGFLAHRLRPAVSLRALLADYFRLPVEVEEFQGRWLELEERSQSRLGGEEQNNRLGVNAVIGDHVWDIQGKIRIRVGPLSYQQLEELLPDPAPVAARKTFFQVSSLVRLFVGPTLDFEVQLVLRAEETPDWGIDFNEERGARLGWNVWLPEETLSGDRDDAVFDGDAARWLSGGEE